MGNPKIKSNHNSINGVVTAKVIDSKDPEKLGRVRVKYPGMKEKGESGWVRVASLMAGKDRGTFFLPEKGDEVLVAFENGDFNHPFIIGALWSNSNKPPEKNADGNNDIKLIKSRAGHTITLDDTKGKEKIEIKTKSGHKILFEDTKGKEIIEIADNSGSNKISLNTRTKSMKIECGKDLTLKAMNIKIEAGANLTLKGKSGIKGQANGPIEMKTSSIATLKGAMVKIN